MTNRDQRIAELEEQLGRERAYSEVLETFVMEKIVEEVEKTSEERLRDIATEEVLSLMGNTNWQTLSQRFDTNKTPGAANFNIDDTLEEIKYLLHQIQFDVVPQMGIDMGTSDETASGV